jgi:hypothetical protein
MNRRELGNCTFESREVQSMTEDVQKKQVLVFDAPRSADAEIRKLGVLVCSIPAEFGRNAPAFPQDCKISTIPV